MKTNMVAVMDFLADEGVRQAFLQAVERVQAWDDSKPKKPRNYGAGWFRCLYIKAGDGIVLTGPNERRLPPALLVLAGLLEAMNGDIVRKDGGDGCWTPAELLQLLDVGWARQSSNNWTWQLFVKPPFPFK